MLLTAVFQHGKGWTAAVWMCARACAFMCAHGAMITVCLPHLHHVMGWAWI